MQSAESAIADCIRGRILYVFVRIFSLLRLIANYELLKVDAACRRNIVESLIATVLSEASSSSHNLKYV